MHLKLVLQFTVKPPTHEVSEDNDHKYIFLKIYNIYI